MCAVFRVFGSTVEEEEEDTVEHVNVDEEPFADEMFEEAAIPPEGEGSQHSNLFSSATGE